MRQGRKIGGTVGTLLSVLAAWVLLMPANLYGVLGGIVVTGGTLVWNKRRETHGGFLPSGFRWRLLPAIAVVEAVAVVKFCERWSLSGKVRAIAAQFGLPIEGFLAIIGIIGAIIAIPAVAAFTVSVTGKAAEEERDGHRIAAFDVFFFAILSLMIAMQFALAPGADGYPGSDSAVFLYIGERMKQGAVPYRDLFDHKGLYLYFIEYIGLLLGGGNFWGVWVLEVCNLFVAALLLLRVTKLFTAKRGVQYASVSLVLVTVTCYMTYEGGNLVEEYALPWITLALLIFMKYFKEGSYRFYEIVLLGISFAVTALLRVNMIAVWAAFLPVVLILLLCQKKWGEIGKCIAGFIAGLILGVLPAVIYCLATGSLSDLLWCYLQFNFGYSDSEGSLLSVAQTAWFLLRQTAVWIAALLVSARLFYKNKCYLFNLWFIAVTLLLASMSGRLYYHYGMILLPAMIVPVTLTVNQCGGWFEEKAFCRVLLAVAGAFFLVHAAENGLRGGTKEPAEISAYLMEHTASDADVLVIGNDCRYYLESGRVAQNRFFYQTPPINVSDEVYEAFFAELEEKQADVIVLIGEKDSLKKEDNHLADVCEKLDNWCTDGVYSWDEHGSYGIYTRNTGEK